MAGFSEAAANKALDHALSTTTWSLPAAAYVSLHTASPGETGANEVVGGSYGRAGDTAFDAASGGATSNTNDIVYTSMPAVVATHIGVWDAITSGSFLFGGAFTAPQTILLGETFTILAGDLDLTLD